MPTLSRRIVSVACAVGASLPLLASASGLYRTGPAEDVGYVRFVNLTTQPVSVTNAGGQALELLTDKPVSDFLAAPTAQPIRGSATAKSGSAAKLDLKVGSEAFVTVLLRGGQEGLEAVALSETPQDFNALRASLALYADARDCKNANVVLPGTEVRLFTPGEGVPRRQVNPVSLSVQLECDGKQVGEATAPVALRAGGRYSLVVRPGSSGPSVLVVEDAIAP